MWEVNICIISSYYLALQNVMSTCFYSIQVTGEIAVLLASDTDGKLTVSVAWVTASTVVPVFWLVAWEAQHSFGDSDATIYCNNKSKNKG
jgi:hypothetical protein